MNKTIGGRGADSVNGVNSSAEAGGAGGANAAVEVYVMVDPSLDPTKEQSLRHLAQKVVASALRIGGFEGERAEVSVLFTNDAFIADLNARFRGVSEPTDVLAFALGEDEGCFSYALGDVAVSLETAERQASVEGKSLDEEVALLLAHGTLHLLGHDHDEVGKEAVMWKRQDEVLRYVASLLGP